MISRAQYAASTMNYYTSAARVGRTASAACRPQGKPHCGGRLCTDLILVVCISILLFKEYVRIFKLLICLQSDGVILSE